MLPKKKRLSTALFKKVISIGNSAHAEFFVVRYIKDKSPLRFAVSVPKKVSKTAVERNKVRRRIYSAINSFKDLSIENMKVILIAKPNILKLNTNDMKPYIKKTFVNLGLLK